MLVYSLKRILWIIPTILIVSFIIYFLMDLAPGTVIDSMISDSMSQEDIEKLRAEYDLDKPVIYRYGKYMLNLARGNLGNSQVNGMSVWDIYVKRFPMTLSLALCSLLVAVMIAIPLGIFAAKHSGTIWDNLTTGISLLGISMPTFWIGLLLLFAFTYYIKIFPVAYDGTFKSYILPSVTSGFMMSAATTRQTRSAMLEVLRQDYLRTARAKGVSERQVTWKHALRNALIPIITQVGMALARTFAGSVIIESVFGWPGIGKLTVDAINQRDVPLACGGVILTLIVFIIMVLIVDLLYALVDPRIRAQYTRAKRKVAS
ncbi:MAG: ABC transporter permease [Bacillota bacterium]